MFWENFSRLCAEQNIKPNPLAKKLGIPSASITNWKNGRTPHHTTLIKIADYFGVTVDYLLGKEEKPPIPPAVATEDEELIEYLEELKTRPEMRMLFSLSKNATKEDVEDAVRIIEALRKGRQS